MMRFPSLFRFPAALLGLFASVAPILGQEPVPAVVDADWLRNRMGTDPGLVVLHVANSDAPVAEWIPGARGVRLSDLLIQPEGLPNEFPPLDVLEAVLEGAGISDGSTVVVYGPAIPAARVWVTLDRIGMGARSAFLDGGIAGWKEAGYPVEAAPGAPATPGILQLTATEGMLIEAPEVEGIRQAGSARLLDARPEAQYSGADPGGSGIPRPGHIPGAVSLFWERMMSDPATSDLRSREELAALLAEEGFDPGSPIVTYCRTGMQASLSYLVARWLGHPVRLYDGSFVDWSPRLELPVATGGPEGL